MGGGCLVPVVWQNGAVVLCWGTGGCAVGLVSADHMKVSVLEIPYLEPLTDSERLMEKVVAQGAARQSAADANLPLDGYTLDQRYRNARRHWAELILYSLMPLLSALATKVPADTLATLLPYNRVDRFHKLLDAFRSGTLRKSRLSMRQRAFGLGLFKKYFLSIVTARLGREAGVPFVGLVDVPGLMREPLRSVPSVPYIPPTTSAEEGLERLVECIADHLARTGDFDPQTAVPADLPHFRKTEHIADVFQRVFCSAEPFTEEEDAQIRAFAEQQQGLVPWKHLNAAMPHRRAKALMFRWANVLSKGRHAVAAVQQQQQQQQQQQHLLRGLFCKYQVPINHPYWTDCLGYDSTLTVAAWPEAAASAPPLPPATTPADVPQPAQAPAAAEDAPAGGICPASDSVYSASASGSDSERDSAAAATSDSGSVGWGLNMSDVSDDTESGMPHVLWESGTEGQGCP